MSESEALKEAISILKFYGNIESWSTCDNHQTYTNLEYDKDLGKGDHWMCGNTNDSNVSGVRARDFLSKMLGEDYEP